MDSKDLFQDAALGLLAPGKARTDRARTSDQGLPALCYRVPATTRTVMLDDMTRKRVERITSRIVGTLGTETVADSTAAVAFALSFLLQHYDDDAMRKICDQVVVMATKARDLKKE